MTGPPPALPVAIRAVAPEATYALRHRVLWPSHPPAHVQLADDAAGHHFGAFRGEELLAVLSLFVSSLFVSGQEARFRKFATRPDCQRQGLGTALLQHVLAEARRLGATRIWCDARQESAGFYARFGLRPAGAVFWKGPVAYVRMARAL